MKLHVIPGEFAVCKLADLSGIRMEAEFWFLARTDEELSLVCRSESVPENHTHLEDGWRMFRIEGVLDFSLTGILAGISHVLADATVGIFAVSTYNTDYVLVKKENLDRAVEALRGAGYEIS